MALLSRQWETRLAKEKQEAAIAPRYRRGDQHSMSRSRTEMALAEATNRPPVMNPRHRRSKSVGGDTSVWLEHREDRPTPLGTVLSPTGINVRKSATKISLQDTLKATNYLLHHQTATPQGDVETKLYKVLSMSLHFVYLWHLGILITPKIYLGKCIPTLILGGDVA